MEGIGLQRTGAVFGGGDVEVDDDGFLAAADDYGLDGLIFCGVKFLVRHVGWNINEITGAGLVDKFQVISPAEACASANNVDYRFKFSVVMRSGLSGGMDKNGAGPEFLATDTSMGDGFGPSHARSLRRIGVELSTANDAQAVVLPVRFFVDGGVGRHKSSLT